MYTLFHSPRTLIYNLFLQSCLIVRHPSNSNLPRQPNIPRTRPNKNPKLPTRNNPLPTLPNTQIPPPQFKRRRPTRPRLQLKFTKPTELLRRRVGRRRVPDVELRHLCARDAAAVGYLGGHGGDGFEEVGCTAGGDFAGCGTAGRGAGYGEGGVGEVCVGCAYMSVMNLVNGSHGRGGGYVHSPKPNSKRGSILFWSKRR